MIHLWYHDRAKRQDYYGGIYADWRMLLILIASPLLQQRWQIQCCGMDNGLGDEVRLVIEL